MQWQIIDSPEKLSEAIELSLRKKVAIFKHSTRCSISSAAKDRIERQWHFDEKSICLYFLDLIKYRALSNQVSEITGIAHQSPQLIILQNKKAIYDASHSGIMPRFIPEEVIA